MQRSGAAAIIAILLAAPAVAQPMPVAGAPAGWSFSLTPYAWASGLSGTVTTPFQRLPRRSVSADFDDLVSDISGFVLMAAAEARKDRVLLVGDLYTVTLRSDVATPGSILFRGGRGEVDLTFATVAALYRVAEEPRFLLDLGLGARAWWSGTTLDLDAGLLPAQRLRETATWIDPILLARAQLRLSGQVSLSAYGDAGGGVGANATWQAIGTLDWMAAPWAVLRAGWRHLALDHAGPELAIDISLSGPILGATLRF